MDNLEKAGFSKEMTSFLQQEQQKALFNEVVSKITDQCYDKCVPSPGDKLSSYETTCLQNCAVRYTECEALLAQRFRNLQ
ncbi:Mitochondrial import inner membrane translocase subunit tim8 [Cymbomonas tetramitiformis]|uniref:Mitochondrial import inner membrane translocase subunit n=1 Tax=Cymbomonas tetramitiformis TaxID=36881 RepID=A0AAE0BFR8_9CHLO|nr:Mitochondrial import inner membrane translocase subunit tim8 [Cymbomonas tetramitiformis]